MRSRGLVVVLAVILATLAVVGLFLYTRSVKEDATKGGALTEVVVSKVDIAANTRTRARENTAVAAPRPNWNPWTAWRYARKGSVLVAVPGPPLVIT